jgi:hypothetical protein
MLAAEQHSAQRDIAFHAEHGCVSMVTGQVGTVLVVVDDRQVNDRAKYSSAKDIPEINPEDE